VSPLNATAHPVPGAPFNHPCFTRDEQRTLAVNLKDVFPLGSLHFKCIGNEFVGSVTIDGVAYEKRGRSPLQLLTYLHELALELRLKEAA
jgi:hypothetical protein